MPVPPSPTRRSRRYFLARRSPTSKGIPPSVPIRPPECIRRPTSAAGERWLSLLREGGQRLTAVGGDEHLVVAHLLQLEAEVEGRVEGAVDRLERRGLGDRRAVGDGLDERERILDHVFSG